ncbi:MAG: phosphatidate cytidylyltransferase, partial [Clostridia bacterium]|nr:phosphatidate cytidylyltransferase [Clostridia bacterium]
PIAQFGDLIFSFIKREQGIKDYSKLIPGHGGLMDRCDSILPVAPLVWIVMRWLTVVII